MAEEASDERGLPGAGRPGSQGLRSSPTALEVVSRQLKRRLGRQWRVGDRLPPVKELARQLGTGQSNTHEAVRHLVREGWLDSRQRRGTFVLRVPVHDGEEESDWNQVLADLRGRTIAVFAHATLEGMFQRMIDAFRAAMEATGATLRARTYPDASQTYSDGAEAMVLFRPGPRTAVEFAADQMLLAVSTASHVVIPTPRRYDLVTVDETHGGMLAGQKFRAMGCERVCFIGRGIPPEYVRMDATSSARLHGFEMGFGKTLASEDLIYGWGYSPMAGGKAFRRYIQRPNRAAGVFAVSDDVAIGFVAAAAAHGLAPGHDYHIVGFDGQDRGQMLGEGSLTTVKVPAVEMGRRAAALLIERFREPDRAVHRLQLECRLQEGTTTGEIVHSPESKVHSL